MRTTIVGIFAALLLMGTGCVPANTPGTGSAPEPTARAKFGEAVSFVRADQSVTFEDGMTITLKEVRDSRCPQGTQCIWAGELSYDFALSGGMTATLGTVTATSVTAGSYKITLASADAPMPTVVVRPVTAAVPPDPSDDLVACTMDAKMCPDGSYVGRVQPNCEFAPCP